MRKAHIFAVLIVLSVILYFFWPVKYFDAPNSTVLVAKNGDLLGAKIAKDGQWRFPNVDRIPKKYFIAAMIYEDKNFLFHSGIDLKAIFRALIDNVTAGKIVSGGSTITMQTIRLARGNPTRTIVEKITEILSAIRIEMKKSKEEIFKLYASHAPFGGNIVGLEAASWRYFGRSPNELSWSESATLAVLPNNPSMIFPGKNQEALIRKRNKLLKKMYTLKIFDAITYQLAVEEPPPGAPHNLPFHAPHLLFRAISDGYAGEKIKTTIDVFLQKRINQIVEMHAKRLQQNDINNIAVLVLDNESGNTLAYIGNVFSFTNKEHAPNVDIIAARRSTGSILKPVLFAALLDDGQILPKTLVPDIPTNIGGYAPENFSRNYDGAVHADDALIRSLNVPAVRMLQKYGYDRFHILLKKLGMSTLNKPSDHYGLTIVLGGAEGTLWDIAGMYASLARSLTFYINNDSRYSKDNIHPPKYIEKETRKRKKKNGILSAGSIWHAFQAMLEVKRPLSDVNWKLFSSAQKISWKTGTSYGFRDAWAIGVNQKYTVGIWAGNADGEGRPGLTGLSAAAPVLFDVFSVLPKAQWFETPFDDMVEMNICKKSGHKATALCLDTETIFVPQKGMKTSLCPYHRVIFVDENGDRVNLSCENYVIRQVRFVLPPAWEWFYKKRDYSYKPLPPYRPDCLSFTTEKNMEWIYPGQNAVIFIPKELSGKKSETIFELAHRIPNTTVFWHLDGKYLGQTNKFHQMSIVTDEGNHKLTAVDINGEGLVLHFEVLERKDR